MHLSELATSALVVDDAALLLHFSLPFPPYVGSGWGWLRWGIYFLLLVYASHTRLCWQGLCWASFSGWAQGKRALQWARSAESKLNSTDIPADVIIVDATVVAQESYLG